MKIAIATSDGGTVLRHFGRAPEFLVAEISSGGYEILEVRENTPVCNGWDHEAERFDASIDIIADCVSVVAAQIGDFAKNSLLRRGIASFEQRGTVESAIKKTASRLAEAAALTEKPAENPKPEGTHPCFNDGAHGKYGRIHLPVSAVCNIKCRFCERDINDDELRPGVSAGILSPEDAVSTVARALELCPDITVAGIAGPGDAMASPYAFETFRRVGEAFPEMNLCLSTNGLGLAGRVAELYDAGVRFITVTVNAVRPEIGERIVSHVIWNGETLTGRNAAELLILRQLAGIREAAAAGLTVKINTVLIPGVNDAHIGEIAKTVSALGAARHNIMALIPNAEFKDVAAPGCTELEAVRAESELYMPQFRNCTHCRADACGVPGVSEFSRELYAGVANFRCNNVC